MKANTQFTIQNQMLLLSYLQMFHLYLILIFQYKSDWEIENSNGVDSIFSYVLEVWKKRKL